MSLYLRTNFSGVQSRLIAGIGLIGVSIFLWWKLRGKREKIPIEWREVGKLTDLVAFPVKSCGAVRFNSMECTPMGLRSGTLRDRNFVLVNEATDNFLSARIHPKSVLINPTVEGDKLTLNAPGMETITLDLSNLDEKPTKQITLWEIPNIAIDCGDEVSKWISKYLLNADNGIRLYKFSEKDMDKKRSKLPEAIEPIDAGAFPDFTSYLLINQGSIDDLNSRLNDLEIDAQNFRPNFLISGPGAFEEDNWEWVKIGNVVFKMVKLCTRCILTTIDWKTGVKHPEQEPLHTLKKYRMVGVKSYDKGSPVMGIHLSVRTPGMVNMGDTIYVA